MQGLDENNKKPMKKQAKYLYGGQQLFIFFHPEIEFNNIFSLALLWQ
jgi:hypothetical protein